MCFTHLRRVSADDATTFGWVSAILLLSPIFNLLLTPDLHTGLARGFPDGIEKRPSNGAKPEAAAERTLNLRP